MKELTKDNAEQTVYLRNPGKEDFACMWDGIEYVAKAGELIAMPRYRAYHFDKHYRNSQLKGDLKARPEDMQGMEIFEENEVVVEKKTVKVDVEEVKSVQTVEDAVKSPKKRGRPKKTV